MFKNAIKRLILVVALLVGLAYVGLPYASASDFSCTQIQGTDNIFCVSTTSSAGFYYFYLNTVTGDLTIGP